MLEYVCFVKTKKGTKEGIYHIIINSDPLELC